MNNKKRLQELKQLQINPSDNKLFQSSYDCMLWIDSVAPLLKYDKSHYDNFLEHANVVRITSLSTNSLMPHLYAMLGIVNQAIIELENKIKPQKSAQDSMVVNIRELSIKDLLFASNNYIRFLLLSIVMISFIAGIAFGASKLYKEKIAPLINLYNTKDIPPTNNIVPTTPERKNTETNESFK